MVRIWIILMLPFLGTALGAAGVFVLRRVAGGGLSRALQGFAAGVMSAASVWSLILPAIEQTQASVAPVAAGLLAGFLFVELLARSFSSGASVTAAAVALHNLPEGMAVGVAAAFWLTGGGAVSYAGVLALSVGIAVQNLPEGAIVSLPLYAAGMRKGRAFGYGVLSGLVEPVGALAALQLAALAVPAMPWLLSFSAGAMLCVVASELIPEMRSRLGTACYAVGFVLMMVLDVILG